MKKRPSKKIQVCISSQVSYTQTTRTGMETCANSPYEKADNRVQMNYTFPLGFSKNTCKLCN